MAAKRRAGSQLTQDNWEEEEEVVEDGSFRAADDSVLAKRKIKKATRRLGATAGPSKPSPFSAFKGFSSTASSGSSSTDKSTFGFQVSSSKPGLGSAFQVSSSKPPASNTPMLNFGSSKSADQPSSTAPSIGSDTNRADVKPTLNGGATATNSDKGSEYAAKLSALNLSVSAWIQQHVAKTPVCDLTPVFKDYGKHLAEIEKKYGSGNTNSAKSGVTFGGGAVKFGSQETEVTVQKDQEEATKPNFGGFSFGAKSAGQSEPRDQETGLFGKTSSTVTFGTSGVTFGSSGVKFGGTGATGNSGFTFPGASSQQKKTEEEEQKKTADEDQPPKQEIKVVEEKDALFSIRSKLYYKNAEEFKERGVGMLHLKKPGSSGQILLRADTTLGNIIFNISVPKALPVQRQGKNGVMLIAAMNPPPDKACPQCKKKYVDPQSSNACEGGCTPQATPILLRVKTGDDADKLLEEINKLKE